MNDDEIIRNEHPHEVVMPEGSRIAVSKSAEKTEPSVRKVFQEGEEFVDAHMIIEEGGSTDINYADESVAVTQDVSVHLGYSDTPDRIDNQIAEATLTRKATEIPVLTEQSPEPSPSEPLAPNISDLASTKIETSADTETEIESGKGLGAVPDMDFPARVINLKIENDQLHERLDQLEKRN